MNGLEAFKSQFRFNPAMAFLVGVERECFTADEHGTIVPAAPAVLEHIRVNGWQNPSGPMHGTLVDPGKQVGYELSACQVETRTNPVRLENLEAELSYQQQELERSMLSCGFRALYTEVAPDTMPLDVYPDPSGRYATVTASMPREVLLAACQVAGTHIHVGMPDHETALRVYNSVIGETERLSRLGDHTNGKRLAIYRVVAPQCDPKPYQSWDEYHALAKAKGFENDPRSCWTLIRIAVHGTIEFRMFGVTRSAKEIVSWAKECRDLCLEAAG